jgi:hypothetical protein
LGEQLDVGGLAASRARPGKFEQRLEQLCVFTRVLSYQVARELKAGRLEVILEDFEPTPWPVNVIYPEARLSAAKVRAFADLVVPGLRKELTRIHANVAAVSSRHSGTRRVLKSRNVATS